MGLWRRVSFRAALGLFVALHSRAALARSTARLELVRGEDAGVCPSEPVLRASVAERLGYDPFRNDAEASVRVVFFRDKVWKGQVSAYDAHHVLVGTRDLEGTRSDCQDLADAVTLTITILLDQPISTPVAAEKTPQPIPEKTTLPPPAEPTLQTRLGAEVVGEVGSLPSPAVALGVFVGIRKDGWSADLDAQADLPVETVYATGTARSAIRSLGIAPCRHFEPLSLCVVARAGVIGVDGVDVTHPKHLVAFYAAAGARLGFESRLWGPVSLRVHLDGLATATRTTISVGDQTYWAAPAFSGALGLGLFFRFP